MLKKIIRWFLVVAGIILMILILAIMIVPKIVPQFGAAPDRKALEAITDSSRYRDGKFYNLVNTPMNGEHGSMMQAAWKFIKGGKNRMPEKKIDTRPFSKVEFGQSADKLQFAWFGHSTLLLRIGGKTLLIDPVFSNHASPFSFFGPKAFPYSNNYALSQLPHIDAVLITHDHYDHLDYETVLELKNRVNKFYVPLGVSAHLVHWGIASENITELNWWEETRFDDSLLFACVPMRHFSGRGVADRYATLWAGWVIRSENHTVVHTGDSGYGEHFKDIGEKYGPFDLAMVECGQYNENWPYIHMMPEETVQAGLDLNARHILPIHWGRFNLALHAWTDPAERVTRAAINTSVEVITPVVGEIVSLSPPLPKTHWWE